MSRLNLLAAVSIAAFLLIGCAAKTQTAPTPAPTRAAPTPAPTPPTAAAPRSTQTEPIKQSSASPTQVTFQIKSNYPNKVQVAYYSQTRRGHAWPGGGQAYGLNDYNAHTHTLNCTPGEKICYGAWVTGNSSKYWGAGPNGRYGCSNCCTTCGTGTFSRTLNP